LGYPFLTKYKMPIPINKDELQKAIMLNYSKLKIDLMTIPYELTTVKELEGHVKDSVMSVNNLIAYLIGWGNLVLKWVEKKDKNEYVDFPETSFKWNELGKLAQKFYVDYEKDDFITSIEKLDKTVSEILSIIDKKTNEELYQVSWYDKWTLGRMIQFNTSSPYSNARGRIRKWRK
jgi:hypothetical protein